MGQTETPAPWTADQNPYLPELPPLPDPLRPGQLYEGRDGDLLFAVLPSGRDWEFVTNHGTRLSVEEVRRVYAPLTLVRPVGCEATATSDTAALPDVQELATAIGEALTLPSPAPTTEAMDGWSQLMTRRASRIRSALTHVTNPGLLDGAWALRELRKIPLKTPVDYPTEDGKKPPTPYDDLIGKWVTVMKEGARHPERFKLLRVEDGALWVTRPMHGEDYILLDEVASVELAPANQEQGPGR